jgi:hydroxymethylpyrimidine/phosphomethylpyrimidine kinase
VIQLAVLAYKQILKVFLHVVAYAASVITATIAQNTKGVIDIHTIPNLHIEKQLDAVFNDINFDAIKVGMLHSCDVITNHP